MRAQRARESQKAGAKDGLMVAAMGLALIAGAVLSMGAPARHARASTSAESAEVGRARAAQIMPAAQEKVSADQASADRDTLDLQLD